MTAHGTPTFGMRRASVPVRCGSSRNAAANLAAIRQMSEAERLTGMTARELRLTQLRLREGFYERSGR